MLKRQTTKWLNKLSFLLRRKLQNYPLVTKNFDPAKVGKTRRNRKTTKPAQKAVKATRSDTLPPPTSLYAATKPTPQKNHCMWEDSIFTPDSVWRELDVLEEMSPSFARLPDIVQVTYAQMAPDCNHLNKILNKEMLSYYATALLWGRLLGIKDKNQRSSLSLTEQDFLRSMSADFNVPQPIYLYLKAIGNCKDRTGKVIYLTDHTLPTIIIQSFGGYHSATITDVNHNLYEEIPSLGIAADVLMPITGTASTPALPTLRPVPTKMSATRALCGYYGQAGIRKEELAIALNAVGVTATTFNSTTARTRLNIALINYVSDVLAQIATFRNERVNLGAMTAEGDASQLMRSEPTGESQLGDKWTDHVVRPYHCNRELEAILGAVYFTGFQLYKEPIGTEENTANNNWSCAIPTTAGPVPEAWVSNRNDRRTVPAGFDIKRFAGLSDSQKMRTITVIRRMIKTVR